MDIAPKVKQYIEGSIGKLCCLKRIGDRRSLVLGFGEKTYHNDKSLADNFEAEWCFMSFESSWRVIENGVVVSSNYNSFYNETELQEQIDRVQFLALENIDMLSNLDISLQLSNNIRIDFITSHLETDDDIINIFCPNNMFVGYNIENGWESYPSNAPKP